MYFNYLFVTLKVECEQCGLVSLKEVGVSLGVKEKPVQGAREGIIAMHLLE